MSGTVKWGRGGVYISFCNIGHYRPTVCYVLCAISVMSHIPGLNLNPEYGSYINSTHLYQLADGVTQWTGSPIADILN